jgi:hypothetical protein
LRQHVTEEGAEAAEARDEADAPARIPAFD